MVDVVKEVRDACLALQALCTSTLGFDCQSKGDLFLATANNIPQSVRAAIDGSGDRRYFSLTKQSTPTPIAPQIVLWLHFRARNWPREANTPMIMIS